MSQFDSNVRPSRVSAISGYRPPTASELYELDSFAGERLLALAASLRDQGHGNRQTYSAKVFIPLTRLCRDVCAYCTFAQRPHEATSAYLSRGEVLAIA